MPVNHRLRDQRLRRGWSLETAAERLNQLASAMGEKQVAVTASAFGKWERVVHQPRGVYRELLCLLYDATAEELGLYQPAGIEATLEDMNRRLFLQGLGAVTGLVTSVALEPWQRLTAALRQPSRVDRQTVAELERVTAGLEALEPQVSPRALLGPVLGHLNTVAALLQGSLGLTLRRQLASVAGETAGLAGWLAWDLEDRRAVSGPAQQPRYGGWRDIEDVASSRIAGARLYDCD